MFVGRVRAALRLLSLNTRSGLLSLDEILHENPSNPNGKTVREILEEKHPEAGPVLVETIVPKPAEDSFHPIIFSKLTPDVIRKCALQTEGAAGPSGLDAMN